MLLLDPQELEYLLEHLGHPETLKEKKISGMAAGQRSPTAV